MNQQNLQKFQNFLDVINQSYRQNKDKASYLHLFPAFDKIFNHRKLAIAVYQDDPGTPDEYFTVQFEDDHFEIAEHGSQQPVIAWKLSEDYMQKVIDESQSFIEHPEKLDWEWLKSRIASMM